MHGWPEHGSELSPRVRRCRLTVSALQDRYRRAQLVENEADRFLAQDMESVCGFKVQEYVNPRNPDVDGLFFLEFFDRIPEERAVAYAATEVEMTAPCRYLMKLNTDFDVEVYINGEITFKTKGPSFGNLFFVDFKAGKNRIAIKSPHEKGFWAVVLSAIDGPLTSEEEVRRAEAWMRVARDRRQILQQPACN